MKTHSIKYTIYIKFILISLITLSCAWGPTIEELRVYLFNPQTTMSKEMYPFSYSTHTLNDYWDSELDKIPDENIEEWFNYFNQNIEKEEIKNLIPNLWELLRYEKII